MKNTKLVEAKSYGVMLPEESARLLDELVKDVPQNDPAYRPRQKALTETTEVDHAGRCDVSVISTEDVDSQVDLVIQSGLDFSVFEKNRTVFYQHDRERPVGRSLWWMTTGPKTIAKTNYPERPEKYEGEWLADKVWAMTQAGLCPGKSVTIAPVRLSDPTPEQRQKGAEIIWDQCIVIEYSAVTIPANSDCIVQAVEKGLNLELLGIRKTGQRVKPKTRRTVYKDRTPELLKAMELLSLDPSAIADKVLQSLANRGRI